MPASKTSSTILFPIDFSRRCEQVAPAARMWAGLLGSKVVLVHAVEGGGVRQASTRLKDFAERHFAGLMGGVSLKAGEPGEGIAAAESEWQPGMIVIPTHGHGTFRRLLAGSVTAKVLHDAQCPVWTSAHSATKQVSRKPPKKILCAIDAVPGAVPLVRWADRLAERTGATVQLLHVMPAVDETSENRGEKAVRRFWNARAKQDLAPILASAGHKQVLLRGGDIATRIAEAAASEKADLLVIGRGHARGRLGRLRTHSLPIVCKSPCPVISV